MEVAVSNRLIMNFVLKPSLEHMALAKVVISLWNQNDVRALITKPSSSNLFLSKEWETIEERVIEKVTQLSLPQLLKENVLHVIKPIGLEILEWIKFHCIHFSLPVHLPAEFFWTPQGTVDSKKTAEVLVKDDNLDISTRYELACIYCFEKDIHKFWNRLPEHLKDPQDNFPIINFWSDNMKRGGVGPISYLDVSYSSVGDSNKVAAKYFLQKLTPHEREECIKELAEEYADVLCFLLPEMEEEEQKKVLKNNTVDVLECFLQWPWQSLFIEVANCMWDFLSKSNYEEILGDIIHKVQDGYKDYNYQKLFREYWQKGPNTLKDSFKDEIDDSWLLRCLFFTKDKENFRLILKDSTPTAKAKLIYSNYIYDYLKHLILKNEWDFLEFFIRECLPSKNEMLKFKKEFEKCKYFKNCSATKKHEWNQLFVFSDDSICKHGKRSVEEGESSSSKRFQILL